MTKAINFTSIVSTLALAATLCANCLGEENVRLYAADGWQIPGLAKILQTRPVKEESLDAAGAAITARTYKTHTALAYKVMLLSRNGDTNYVRWISLLPRLVTAYHYQGKLISVLVNGVMQAIPERGSGAGGTTGEIRLFYEDDDGSGKFHLLIQNPRFDFQPGVPEWAK